MALKQVSKSGGHSLLPQWNITFKGISLQKVSISVYLLFLNGLFPSVICEVLDGYLDGKNNSSSWLVNYQDRKEIISSNFAVNREQP